VEVVSLSRAFRDYAISNMLTWLSLSAALVYLSFETVSTTQAIRGFGYRLTIGEFGLYIFTNNLFLTYGILFFLALINTAVAQGGTFDRLLFVRMKKREGIWLARAFVQMGASSAFLAILIIVWGILSLGDFAMVNSWSEIYSTAPTPGEYGEPSDFIIDALTAASAHYGLGPLYSFGILVVKLQLVMWAVSLGVSVLFLYLSQAKVLFISFVYLTLFLVAHLTNLHMLAVVTPQFFLLEQPPNIASFCVWIGVIIALALIGNYRVKSARLS